MQKIKRTEKEKEKRFSTKNLSPTKIDQSVHGDNEQLWVEQGDPG